MKKLILAILFTITSLPAQEKVEIDPVVKNIIQLYKEYSFECENGKMQKVLWSYLYVINNGKDTIESKNIAGIVGSGGEAFIYFDGKYIENFTTIPIYHREKQKTKPTFDGFFKWLMKKDEQTLTVK